MKKALKSILFFALLFNGIADAQEFKGHLKLLNNLFIPHPDTLIWFSDQTLENRLEIRWDATDWLRFDVQARSRLVYGDFVENLPNYSSLIGNKQGWVDLSFLWADGRSFVGHTELDRLSARVSFKSVELTIGRQRINWGFDLVWNPNDVFNTSSYLNLEYPERPGTDAVNLKVHTGALSYLDFVYQPNKTADSSAYGVRYRTHIARTDFQVLAARMADYYVLGGGLSGELGQFALRSEVSYFGAQKLNAKSGFVATLSADRSIGGNSFMQLGALYNSFGSKSGHEPLSFIEPKVQSPMMLSRGKVNFFVGINSTVATLFTPSLAILANPADGSAAIIPGIAYSASDNLILALTAIVFTGHPTEEYQNMGQLAYFKVQSNF